MDHPTSAPSLAAEKQMEEREDARAHEDAVDEGLPPHPMPNFTAPFARMQGLTSASSSSHATQQMECWICFDPQSSDADPIVTNRCQCRGSVGFVHQKCIDRWVIRQQNRTCRSCGAEYRLMHTDYPPNVHVPVGPIERRNFLLKFLVKPFASRLGEALLCTWLRFVCVPLLLGLVYNYERWEVLLWIFAESDGAGADGDSFVVVSSRNATEGTSGNTNHLLARLFRGKGALNTASPATPLLKSSKHIGYLMCFGAWADTLLFGLILCVTMNAVWVGWRRWKKYFRTARRQRARADELAQAAAVATEPHGGTMPPAREGEEGEHAVPRQQTPTQEHMPDGAPILEEAMEEQVASGVARAAEPWQGRDFTATSLLDFPAAASGADSASREERENKEEQEVYAEEAALPPLPPDDPAMPLPGWQPDWDHDPVNRELYERYRRADYGGWEGLGFPEDYYPDMPLPNAGDVDDDDDFEDVDSDAASSASTADSDTDSEDDDAAAGADADSDEDAPARLSFVDELFDAVDWIRSNPGGGGMKRITSTLFVQIRAGLLLAVLLRSAAGRVAVLVACIACLIGWRCFFQRNVLANPKRRFDEVTERVPLLTDTAVRTLFFVYLVDAFFFYVALPLLGGVTLHYAVSPYMDVGMDAGFFAFTRGLTVWKLTLYWVIGALLVMLLTAMELTVVSMLFAHGVELFFVRSFDSRWDSVLGYWRCVITQVFDSDPLRVVVIFARVAVVELLVLVFFVRLPFWGMLEVRQFVWGDATAAVPMTFEHPYRMSFSLGMRAGCDVDPDITLAEWRKSQALQLLDERVLQPFGAIYTEMLRSSPSSLSHRAAGLASPEPMDPLVAAAMMVTNVTPAEMWSHVWGNLSNHAVFTFYAVDPAAAMKVAENSDGFAETLWRVTTPLEWLRHATMLGSVCDTITALTGPTAREREEAAAADASPRIPNVEMEPLLQPPAVTLPYEGTAAARSRQRLYDAWQRARQQAAQHVSLVTRHDAAIAALSLYAEVPRRAAAVHSVTAVNCYISAIQLTDSYVRLGYWYSALVEWWSMMMVRNTFFNYGLFCILYMIACGTVMACFAVFPLQRAQLRLLLPYVQWVGRHVVRMGDYLFDADQLRAVEEFLQEEGEDEVVLPPMVEPLGFNRREDFLEPERIPSFLLLRRVVVAVLFLAGASAMVWTVPILFGSFLLCFTTNALPVLLGSAVLSFVVWNPSSFGRSIVFGMALTMVAVFMVPILFVVYVSPFLQLFWRCYPNLVEETFERHYNVHQMVGPYNNTQRPRNCNSPPPEDGHQVDLEEVRRRGFAGGAVADLDEEEWESVESSSGADGDEERAGQDVPVVHEA